jgi:hypothetical protein
VRAFQRIEPIAEPGQPLGRRKIGPVVEDAAQKAIDLFTRRVRMRVCQGPAYVLTNVINRSPSYGILIVCIVDGYDPGMPQLWG